MPSYDMNAYYHPERHGAQVVATLEREPEYDFDMVVVLRGPTGLLFAAHDAGCSCPTPFEDHEFPQDWTLIQRAEDLRPLVDQISGVKPTDVIDFYDAVRRAL